MTRESESLPSGAVAEIEEERTAAIDLSMEGLGGVVYRRALSDVEHAGNSEAIAAMKADLAQMKAEPAQATTDRKAKLREKVR